MYRKGVPEHLGIARVYMSTIRKKQKVTKLTLWHPVPVMISMLPFPMFPKSYLFPRYRCEWCDERGRDETNEIILIQYFPAEFPTHNTKRQKGVIKLYSSQRWVNAPSNAEFSYDRWHMKWQKRWNESMGEPHIKSSPCRRGKVRVVPCRLLSVPAKQSISVVYIITYSNFNNGLNTRRVYRDKNLVPTME